LGSGAPWYNVYETRDGRFVALGSNEARFYRNTVRLLGLREEDLPDQHDRTAWPKVKGIFAAAFKTRTREEWCALFDGEEACLAPVLSLEEAPQHPHQVARGNFVAGDAGPQPAPVPRFSRTPGAIQRPPPRVGEHTDEVLHDWGFAADEIARLRRDAVIT
jgi:alpha-methylacyl-CoA racemase